MADKLTFHAVLQDDVTKGLLKIGSAFDKVGGKGSSAVFFGTTGSKLVSEGYHLIERAASAATGFLVDSVSKASDFNETLQKSQVVFGSAAIGVKDFASTAATQMGLSENAALAAAATFGNLFTSLGTAPQQVAPMSEALVKLASDLASFNNIPVEEALAKLQSGIVGQERPLRELGVAISAASVDIEAANLGFKKINGTFTEGEKVQARYSLIFKQTATAQGDFARTADGMANQQRTLNAQFDDAQVVLGEKLIPFVIAAQKALIGLFSDIEKGKGPVVDTVNAILGLGTALDTLSGRNQEAAASSDVLGSKTTPLGQAIHSVADSITYLVGTQQDMVKGNQDVSASLDGPLHGAQELAGSLDGPLHDAIVGNVILWRGWGSSTVKPIEDVVVSFDDMVAKLKSDTNKLIDDVFDPTIERDKLRADQAEATAARVILASSKSSNAEKRDARATLHQLAKDNIAIYTQLLESGDITTTEYSRLMHLLRERSKTATGKAKDDVDALIVRVQKLYGVMVSGPKVKISIDATSTGSPYHKKAAGGPVHAGTAYTVGEQGPETFVAPSNGYIIPHGGSSGGMGGSWGGSINLTYAPRFSTASAAEAREFARAILPELQREKARQGVA